MAYLLSVRGERGRSRRKWRKQMPRVWQWHGTLIMALSEVVSRTRCCWLMSSCCDSSNFGSPQTRDRVVWRRELKGKILTGMAMSSFEGGF